MFPTRLATMLEDLGLRSSTSWMEEHKLYGWADISHPQHWCSSGSCPETPPVHNVHLYLCGQHPTLPSLSSLQMTRLRWVWSLIMTRNSTWRSLENSQETHLILNIGNTNKLRVDFSMHQERSYHPLKINRGPSGEWIVSVTLICSSCRTGHGPVTLTLWWRRPISVFTTLKGL